MRIENDIINDSRLTPLLNVNSKLLFQIYVLEIKNLSTSEKNYRIVYGWCFITTRDEISNKVTCRNEFTRLLKTEHLEYSINKLNIFHTSDTIIKIINHLLSGGSLIDAATLVGLNVDSIKFDVKLQIDNIAIRPVIFNETNGLISRNPYSKNVFTSPYKEVPSFTLSINNLYKEGILKADNGDFYDNWENCLLKTLDYLQEDTTMPFKTASCARFGNIELINTKCSDQFEVHDVWHECIKEEVKVDYKTESSCRKVKVTIKPNIHTCNRNILINCFLLNGEQVTLDECKNIFHNDNAIISTEFESEEPIGKVSVNIWVEENGNFQIWYKNSAVLIREMYTNMGVVGLNGIVKSPWLDTIKNSNAKTKTQVTEAQKISKASYNTMSTGGYKLDPWVKSDRNFASLINQLLPEKSDAEFFSKGWDVDDDSHGAISFLEWFKRITDKAQKVVIQDPFYDTLGLEFLARTTNAATEFSILTCTQIKSTDDNESGSEESSEPNRAMRIKTFITSNPSLLGELKLNVYDVRSSGGGDKNIIHDRYLLIFEDDTLKKGFHLSNSIQGATKNHPLLITPIPKDILVKVDNSINNVIQQSQTGSDFNIIKLYQYENVSAEIGRTNKEVIANEDIHASLIDKIPSKEALKEDVIKSFVCEDSFVVDTNFSKSWSTMGYFLAHTHYADDIIQTLAKIVDTNFIVNLRKYLENSISEDYPLGYLDETSRRIPDFRFLIKDSFDEIIKQNRGLEGYLYETTSYGNWGVYYGCRLLLDTSFEEYVKLIDFVNNQYTDKMELDLANSPIQKLSSKVFTNLIEQLFWCSNISIIEQTFQNEFVYIRALGAISLLKIISRNKAKVSYHDAKELLLENLSTDESLSTLKEFLLNLRFRQNISGSTTEKQVFNVILNHLENNFTKERLSRLLNDLLNSPYPLIEKRLTDYILSPLVIKNILTWDDVFKLWSTSFFKIVEECESYKDYSGIIDLTGWSLQNVGDGIRTSFIVQIKKIYNKNCNEIRAPFKKGSITYNNAFEKILILRTVLIISVLYEGVDKSTSHGEMKELINEIEALENSYQFSMSYSNIYAFSKQILEKYKC
ncbi:MAG: hypothetical protein HRT66_02965 [Flavobacteriaceae bacterium]|nr:hypothetical protein [Flavobacteriaceae bacterium]